MRNRNNVQIQKLLKDYAVPLVWLVLIILLVGSYFFWGAEEPTVNTNENQIGLDVGLDTPDTEAYITYSGDEYNKKIEGAISMYKGEKVQVKSGTVTLSSTDYGNFRLGKLWELKFEETGNLSLYSSDLWVKNTLPIVVDMRYAKVNIGQSSVVNLTQNEAGSTIYNVSWFVEVFNIAGKSTVIAKGQKITILRSESAKEDVDITLAKDDIDDYFMASDWFLKNGGDAIVAADKKEEMSGTWATGTWATATGATQAATITLTNLQDEQTVKESVISVSGTVGNPEVAFVSIANQKVPVRETDFGFELKGVQLTQKTNDIILKTYDGSGNLIGKYPYTIYLEGTAAATGPKDLFDVKNFSLDASKFKFIAPKSNPLTTTERILTIEGMVPANTVEKIDVNGFVLTKFPSGGTYWKYHVNADYGNLKDGLNIYEVKYMGKDGVVLHKNAFTIIKETEGQKPVNDETATGTTVQ